MFFGWQRKKPQQHQPEMRERAPLQESIIKAEEAADRANAQKAILLRRTTSMLQFQELPLFLSIRENLRTLHSNGKITFSAYLGKNAEYLLDILALAIVYLCPAKELKEFRVHVTDAEDIGNGVAGQCAHSGEFSYKVTILRSSFENDLAALLLIDEFCHLAQFYSRDSRGLKMEDTAYHCLLGGFDEAMHDVLSGLDRWSANTGEPLPGMAELEGKGTDISHRFGLMLANAVLKKVNEWLSQGLITREEGPMYARAYLQLFIALPALKNGSMDSNVQRIASFSNMAYIQLYGLTMENAVSKLEHILQLYCHFNIPDIFRTRAFEAFPIKLHLFPLGEWSVQASRVRKNDKEGAYETLLQLRPALEEINAMLLEPARNGEWGKYHIELARIFATDFPDELLSKAAKSLPQ